VDALALEARAAPSSQLDARAAPSLNHALPERSAPKTIGYVAAHGYVTDS